MLNSTRFDLILFDLDGTLIETAAEIAESANDVLRAEGYEPLPLPMIRDWIGHGARETVVKAMMHASGRSEAQLRVPAELDRLMVIFGRSHAKHCGTASTLFPDVRESLDALESMGIRLALVTNKESRFADQVLDAHGLRRYFSPMICGDTLPVKKPDAQTVRYCIEQHGAIPARTILVGDSSVDVATARNAGIECWAVPYGYNGGQHISVHQPHVLINSFADLVIAARATDQTINEPSRRAAGVN